MSIMSTSAKKRAQQQRAADPTEKWYIEGRRGRYSQYDLNRRAQVFYSRHRYAVKDFARISRSD